MRICSLLLGATVSLGCESPRPALDIHAHIPEGQVARVGPEFISEGLLSELVSVDDRTRREALELAVEDTLFSLEARRRGLDRTADLSWHRTANCARRTAERLKREAHFPISESELEAATARYWKTLDRPEQAVVVHAIVLMPPSKEAGKVSAARQLAMQIRESVKNARSGEEFHRLAAAVPTLGHSVEIQDISAFTKEGRLLDEDEVLDATFARESSALTREAPLSEVVESPFGFHVIRLLDRLPASRATREERLRALSADIEAMRARKARDALVATRLRNQRVSVEPAADALMTDALRHLGDVRE